MREKSKLVIAGSRTFDDYRLFRQEVDDFLLEQKLNKHNCTVLSGHAKGADIFGEFFAKQNEFNLLIFPANWSLYGRAAGMIRNRQMVDVATHCLAFWDGKSRGTKNMIELAKERNLIYKVILV